ncbi:hypothetical protein NDU88_007540 [Pleurodeles waltl]|uniref:Uncharacterized protein n=1 Tax=Pleurodeles waltl TaxID=8319 RepID=A0AAV7PQJ5_PLEWA|nr:hypothetical protein NDU88_007540 [Pleurodeles waltl]
MSGAGPCRATCGRREQAARTVQLQRDGQAVRPGVDRTRPRQAEPGHLAGQGQRRRAQVQFIRPLASGCLASSCWDPFRVLRTASAAEATGVKESSTGQDPRWGGWQIFCQPCAFL